MVKKTRRPSLLRQAQYILDDMFRPGQSKHLDKIRNGGKPDPDTLYSYGTFGEYLACIARFIAYVSEHYKCRYIEDARIYVAEYLRLRISQNLSAWTIHTDASALAKLYHSSYVDFGVVLPARRRGNIRRYLGTEWSRTAKYTDLVLFCRATGLRRHELRKLRPSDVFRGKDGEVYVVVRQGKGGKRRTVLALDPCVLDIAQAAAQAGREFIFKSIPQDAPIHGYRREYAKAIYNMYARPLDTLDNKSLYRCRADMAGVVYDRNAMFWASYYLGHNRIGVVTTYLKDVNL